jgi:nucleotide-binding universal stress UspA family protein
MADEGGVADQVRQMAAEGGYGLIVIPPPSKNLLSSLVSASLTELTKNLECPLLLARGSAPYKKVLIPFNGESYAEKAMEVTVDMAKQLGVKEVDAVVVSEPGFITGDDGGDWLEEIGARIDELAHIHKMRIGKVTRKGNPVNEISAVSGEYDLIVIGSDKKGKGLFSPNVAEHLARKTECSALLVP